MTVRVVIVHQGEDIPGDENYAPLRYGRLAAALTADGVEVTRLVPSFRHLNREQRSTNQELLSQEGAVHVVPTASYEGSISLGRARFTTDFVTGAARYLHQNRHFIDATLIGVPPPGMVAAGRLALGPKRRLVADVRDVWPDCLAVGPRASWEPMLKVVGRLVSQEMRLATATVAVSQPMLDWVPARAATAVVPIGMAGKPLKSENFPEADSSLKVCFISNHTLGFAFIPVLRGWSDFVDSLQPDDPEPEFAFIGAEPAEPAAHELASRLPSVRFAGRVGPDQVGGMLSRFDVGLAPTTPRFGDSLANKVFDYLGAGLFVSHSMDPAVSQSLDQAKLAKHIPLVAADWAEHFANLHANRSTLRVKRIARLAQAEALFGQGQTTALLAGRVLDSRVLASGDS